MQATEAVGGGGIVNIGTVTLNNSKVTANTAYGDIGGGGGGILNFGPVTLNNSQVTGNTLRTGSGGGIFTLGTLTLNNSTVRGNCPDDIDGSYTQKNSKIGPAGLC